MGLSNGIEIREGEEMLVFFSSVFGSFGKHKVVSVVPEDSNQDAYLVVPPFHKRIKGGLNMPSFMSKVLFHSIF